MIERAGLGDGTTSALGNGEMKYTAMNYSRQNGLWCHGELFNMLALLVMANCCSNHVIIENVTRYKYPESRPCKEPSKLSQRAESALLEPQFGHPCYTCHKCYMFWQAAKASMVSTTCSLFSMNAATSITSITLFWKQQFEKLDQGDLVIGIIENFLYL